MQKLKLKMYKNVFIRKYQKILIKITIENTQA